MHAGLVRVDRPQRLDRDLDCGTRLHCVGPADEKFIHLTVGPCSTVRTLYPENQCQFQPQIPDMKLGQATAPPRASSTVRAKRT